MAPRTSPQPSFSRARKLTIGLNVALAIVAVFVVAVMVNYLSGNYFQRFYLSARTRIELAPQTLSVLRTQTNQVQVILYFDRKNDFFGEISELLREYHTANPKLVVRVVDYLRDPGAAQEVKARYHLASTTDKDLVIFDCEGRTKIVPGDALVQKTLEQLPDSPREKPEFYRKPIAFLGEKMFTGALLAVTNPRPLQACVLQGHGEPRLDDDAGDMGYPKFAAVLQQNHILVQPLSLIANPVPADCNLLVIAGPKDPIPQIELDRIEQYLDEGGRLFVLFNAASAGRETGLEKILAKSGIQVTRNIIQDPEYTTAGSDVVVLAFGRNPAVNPLVGSQLQLILPREIRRLDPPPAAAEGLKVEEIAFSGPHSFVRNSDAAREQRRLPLMVAMEKSPVQSVVTERGLTRILVVGDSLFLGNRQIDSGANRDFAGYAVNWLLDRTILLDRVSPKPITEYRLLITRSQLKTLQWILLGAMPGGVLLLGGLVWLRRRR